MDDVAEAQLGVRAAKRDSEVGAQTQRPIDLHRLHSLVVLTDCAQQAWQAKCLSKTDQVIIQSCVTNQSGYGDNSIMCDKPIRLWSKRLSKTDQVIIQSCVTNQSGYGPNICRSKHQSGDYPKTCHVPVK